MRTGWIFRDVLEGITASPLRTGLTLLSVGTGVLALSLLLSILEGLHQQTEALRREIGAEEVWIQATRKGQPFLASTDMKRLSGVFPDLTLTGVRVGKPTKAPEGLTLDVVGGDPDFARIRGWTLREGRFLDPADRTLGGSPAVVGPTVAERLSLRPGMHLALGRETVTIVGIADQPLTVPGGLGDGRGTLWVPQNHSLLRRRSRDVLDGVLMQVPEGMSPEILVERLMRDWAREWPDADWNILTADRLLRGARRMSRTVKWVYGSVAGLCLGLGGVTLGSLMTLGIKQRQREIGLRLSIGATPKGIFALFLAEGLTVTLLSSCIGLLVAHWVFQQELAPESLPMIWDSRAWMLSLGTAFGLGLLFSLWPASVAARIAPAEAMRSE